MHKGVLYSKPKDLVRIMNEYFISKVKVLRVNIPESCDNQVVSVQKMMKKKNCTFKLWSVHGDEVLKVISNLKYTESCGTDNIDSKVIKIARFELTPVNSHCKSISTIFNFPSAMEDNKSYTTAQKG